MAFRLAARARADLDEIWDYIFVESGSEAIADQVLDRIRVSFEFFGGLAARWSAAG